MSPNDHHVGKALWDYIYLAMPTLADYAEHDAHEKAMRKKTHRGAKKRQKAHSTT